MLSVCACFVIKSCLTLCNPVDYSPLGSLVHGILQARILQWVAISYSRDLPDPGIKLESLALAGRFFTTDTACCIVRSLKNKIRSTPCPGVKMLWSRAPMAGSAGLPQVILEWTQLLQKNAWGFWELLCLIAHSLIYLMHYCPGAVIVIKWCLQKDGDSQGKWEPT